MPSIRFVLPVFSILKISLSTGSLFDMTSIDSTLGKNSGNGADLFFDSLFMTCLNVY